MVSAITGEDEDEDDELRLESYISRPAWFTRAIGDEKNAALRPFDALSFIFVTLPVGFLSMRRRKLETRAAKKSIAK